MTRAWKWKPFNLVVFAALALTLLGRAELPLALAQTRTQETPASLQYIPTADYTATNSSTAAVAASTYPREVTFNVPPNADSTLGIRVSWGAAASSTSFAIWPGQSATWPTKQEIRVIRAGGSNVAFSVAIARAAQ